VYEIVSDRDYCADYPRHKWQLTMSLSSLRERLRRAGLRIRAIQDVQVLQKSPSGRANTILLKTSKGEVQVASNRFRLALGPETLRSTYLTNVQVRKHQVYFEGLGWGHGVGLCQWGSRGRALSGQTFAEILSAYYPKAKLVRI
jgi:stage II sporulation protein D